MSESFQMEITQLEADQLRRRGLPEGVAILERDELVWWDRTYSRTSSGLYVPEELDPIERYFPPAPKRIYALDLFSGCGGFSLGMHWAGIEVVAAAEWDTAAAQTYLANLGNPECRVEFLEDSDRVKWEKAMRKSEPGWIGSAYRTSADWSEDKGCRAFFLGDIRNLTAERILEAAGVPRIDVIFGGPPCQGLSAANSKACLEDPRNALIWEFLRLVEELQPKAFIIENVPQILTAGKGGLFSAIVTRANAAGFDVVAQKINASWHGVPQHRVRALIVGSQPGCTYQFPMPSTWALGRMADGTSWTFLDTETGDDCGERPLATPVVFDAASKTFRMPHEEPVAIVAVNESEDTLDLFEEDAA